MTSVLSVQSSDRKGNQQPGRNKKKGKTIVIVGIGMKMPILMTRIPAMLGGDKKFKRKVKFPCKLCKDDHLTHLCPRIEEASRFIA